MIGFIKKLFSGLLSFLFGLLAGKKSEEKLAASSTKSRKSKGFFLELNESEEQQPPDNQTTKAEPAKKTELVGATKSALAAVAKSVKSDTSANNQPAKAEASANNRPAKAKADNSANNQPENKVELVQTAQGVRPAKASAASVNNQTPTETTFAPKYLTPSASSNGRRRPGPNMNSFLDMARQVKTPG
jgi:hypothetical protein